MKARYALQRLKQSTYAKPLIQSRSFPSIFAASSFSSKTSYFQFHPGSFSLLKSSPFIFKRSLQTSRHVQSRMLGEILTSQRESIDPRLVELAKLLSALAVGATGAWLNFKFNSVSEDDTRTLESIKGNIKEIENQIETQWPNTNALLNKFKLDHMQPLLELYSVVNQKEIDLLEDGIKKIDETLQSNERVVKKVEEIELDIIAKDNYLKEKFASHLLNQTQFLKNQLLIQSQQLRMTRGFCQTASYRKQKKFPLALNSVIEWINEIKNYMDMIKNYTDKKSVSSAESMLIHAYNHQAKIHRALAGMDLDQLDMVHLKKCQESYEEALKIKKDRTILSSLGFLLNDMSAMIASMKDREAMLCQALSYHREAKKMDPTDPNIQHGLGYDLYKIEKYHHEAGQPVNTEALQESLDAFSIVERKNRNARLYHDRGLVHLLMNNQEQAVKDFKTGLELDPNHPLLNYELGMLLLKQRHIASALDNLKRGRMVSVENESLKKKYDELIIAANTQLQQKTELQEVPPDDKSATPHTSSHSSQLVVTSASTTITSEELAELDVRKVAKQAEMEETFRQIKKQYCPSKPPTIFISYAWGHRPHEQRVEQLARELEMAGCEVFLDIWYDRKGKELMDFVEKIDTQQSDYVLVVATPSYLEKYNRRSSDPNQREPVVGIEGRLLDYVVGYSRSHSEKVIPVILEGPVEKALPFVLRGKLSVDLWQGDKYKEMLGLVRSIHRIPNRDMGFKKITQELDETNQAIDRKTTKELAEQYEREMRQRIQTERLKIEKRAEDRIESIVKRRP